MTDAATSAAQVVGREPSFTQYRALIARYLRPQLARVLWMAGLLLVAIVLQLVNPQVIRYFLDTAQAGAATQKLTLAALVFIGFAVLQQALTLAASYLSQDVGWSATNRLRADLALHVLRLDMPFHKQRTPGELIERVDGDVTLLVNFFSQFTIRLLGESLLVVGILVLLFLENIWVGLGMLVYTALSLYAMGVIQKLAVPRWAAERQASAEQFGFIEERISGAEEIRAAGAEAYMLRRLYEHTRSFLQKRRAAMVISSLTYNLTNLIYVIGYSLGLALGVYLYTQGQASLGTAYLIVYYVGMLSEPLQHIREQAEDLQQASASIQRIDEIFRIQPLVSSPLEASQTARIPSGPLSVAFENVAFHYDDNENVLTRSSLRSGPGGCWGFWDAPAAVNRPSPACCFACTTLTTARSAWVGWISARRSSRICASGWGWSPRMCSFSRPRVRENLTFFNPGITDARLEEVLTALRLWDWVRSLPLGLDTPLATGGQGLSAGEAQLLAFCRVFLKDPGLVILDEASSRLDPATETRMERAVDRLFEGRTGVVIAHRLKTVQRADDILILEDGRVVEYGPRQALASDPGSRFSSLLQTGLEEALA